MFGKVSTLMLALKIMLLCLTTNFGILVVSTRNVRTAPQVCHARQRNDPTVHKKQKGTHCHYMEFVRLENLTLLTNFRQTDFKKLLKNSEWEACVKCVVLHQSLQAELSVITSLLHTNYIL